MFGMLIAGLKEPEVTDRTDSSERVSVKVTRESLLPSAEMLLISIERNITEETGRVLGGN